MRHFGVKVTRTVVKNYRVSTFQFFEFSRNAHTQKRNWKIRTPYRDGHRIDFFIIGIGSDSDIRLIGIGCFGYPIISDKNREIGPGCSLQLPVANCRTHYSSSLNIDYNSVAKMKVAPSYKC